MPDENEGSEATKTSGGAGSGEIREQRIQEWFINFLPIPLTAPLLKTPTKPPATQATLLKSTLCITEMVQLIRFGK